MANDKKKSGTSTWTAVKMLLSHLDSYTWWTFFISLALSVSLYCYALDEILVYYGDLSDACFDYCSKLIAFGIAAYAFLLNLGKNQTINGILRITEDGKTIASDIFAGLIWFIFIAFVVLLISLFSKLSDAPVIIILFYWFLIYLIFLFVDILLCLFLFNEFIYPKENKGSNKRINSNK